MCEFGGACLFLFQHNHHRTNITVPICDGEHKREKAHFLGRNKENLTQMVASELATAVESTVTVHRLVSNDGVESPLK